MVKVICQYCKYEWDYGGKLIRACCPSCRRGVLVKGRDSIIEEKKAKNASKNI
jgi:hypothetical protein